MKRIAVVLVTLLIVGIVCIIPCFAEGSYNLSATDTANNITCFLTYADVDGLTSISSGAGKFNFIPGTSYPYKVGFTFYNNNDYSVAVNFLGSGIFTYSIDECVIYPHSSVSLYSYATGSDSSAHNGFVFYTVDEVDVEYSIFNSNSIINTVGSFFEYIYNSNLFGLFIIGICISLGFVVVKFIRKIMWSN